MSQTKVKSGLLNFPDQTDFVKLPSGTTAQRPSSPEKGYSRYNTTDNKLEFWNGTIWQQLPGVVAPIITSISYPGNDLAADPAGGQTITITGTDFAPLASVSVGGTQASVITFVSSTEITFTAPAKTAGDYDIVVTNVDGGNATSVDGMTYNGLPSWTTPAGNLGTFPAGSTIPTITLVATEPDSGVVSYSVTTGALPSGLTLSGADIDGTAPTPAGETTYNFSVTASDDENQDSTERAFNIVVYLQVTNTVSEVDPFGDSSGVALYRLENNANDEGGVYNGTPSNVTYGAGVFSQAGIFNGSNSFISLPSILNIDTQRVTFSVSLWLKIDTPKVAGIFNDYSGTGGYNMIFEGQANGTVRIFNNLGGSNSMDTPNLNDSSWHNVTVMNDTSDNIQYVYVDGNFHDSQPLGTSSKVNASGIFVGKYNISGDYFFDGNLDQIRIFNRVLTPLEVESLYRERTVLCGGQADTLDILGDNSCIATYQLNGNANDLSGNYSGTPTDVSYGVGEFDLAGVFNGSSSYVTIGDYNVFSPVVNDLSVSLWFNTSVASGTKWLATKGAASNYEWAIYATSNGVVGCTMWQFGGSNCAFVFSPDNSYSINTWHNFVVSMDYLGSLSIYLDGQLMDSTTTFTGTMINGSAPVLIGKRADQSINMMNGSIDQVRIFNKALNSTEVTTLYNETACDALACSGTTNTLDILSDGSCIATYPLDGSPADLSGNYNGVQTDVTYPVGEFDLAGAFSSSRIQLPTGASSFNNKSFSLWFKYDYNSQDSFSFMFGDDITNNVSPYNGIQIWSNYNNNNNLTVRTKGGNELNILQPQNRWYHLCVTYDRVSAKIYIDGSYVNQISDTTDLSSVDAISMGANPYSDQQYYVGEIDQVRIFNKALSASEVTTLYNETACN